MLKQVSEKVTAQKVPPIRWFVFSLDTVSERAQTTKTTFIERSVHRKQPYTGCEKPKSRRKMHFLLASLSERALVGFLVRSSVVQCWTVFSKKNCIASRFSVQKLSGKMERFQSVPNLNRPRKTKIEGELILLPKVINSFRALLYRTSLCALFVQAFANQNIRSEIHHPPEIYALAEQKWKREKCSVKGDACVCFVCFFFLFWFIRLLRLLYFVASRFCCFYWLIC